MTAESDESMDSGTLDTGPTDRHEPGHGVEATVDVGRDLVDVEVEIRGAAGDLARGHPAHVGRGESRHPGRRPSPSSTAAITCLTRPDWNSRVSWMTG